MFAGCNFGDAVKDARTAVYEKYHQSNNTWGAYQCYGDPFYKLVNRSSANPGGATEYIMAEQVLMELDNLRNDVDTRNYTCKAIIEKVKNIKEAAKLAGIRDAGIVEAEALIYYELGDYTNAVMAYEQLKHSQHASFSVAALEKYCNVRCKRLVEDCSNGADKQAAIAAMHTIINELDQLRQIEETRERTNLIGSAWRRIAFLSSGKKKKLFAYKKAAEAYAKANAILQKADLVNDEELTEDRYAFKMQTFMQWLHDAIQGPGAAEPLLTENERAAVITRLQQHKAMLGQRYRNMDYWELIEAAAIELLLLALMEEAAGIDDNWAILEKKYRRIWSRAGSKGKIKAEMESFAIITDGLQLATTAFSVAYASRVQGLKDKLSVCVEGE